MATPVAHACAGLACLALTCLAARRATGLPLLPQALACAFAACAPDLDIVLSLLLTGSTTLLHTGPTHSLWFALLTGCIVWMARRHSPARTPIAAAIGLSVASHVLIDYLTGPQPGLHRSFGVPALWPLLDERLQSPFTLFRGVRHGGIAIWFEARNLGTAALELLFAVPATLLSLHVLRRRTFRA